MTVLHTSIGQLLVNDALPEELRDYSRVLDSKGTTALLQSVAEKYPEEYDQISRHLLDIGSETASRTGGYSFGLHHLATPKSVNNLRAETNHLVHATLSDPSMTQEEKDAAIVDIGRRARKATEAAVMEAGRASKNPLVGQVDSGARGKPANVADLSGMIGVVGDHHQDPIPIPILHSYSEGLNPAEHFAGTFGARDNLVGLKLGIMAGGAFAKQLIQSGHRLVVTGDDDLENPHLPGRGLPVDTADPDNEGALLSHPVAGYARDTVLTPKVLKDLRAAGAERIVIRSPIAGGSKDGGLLAKDVGMRGKSLEPTGSMIGITDSQSVGEGIAQQALDTKHRSSGAAGGGLSGIKAFNYMINPPKASENWAAHAKTGGRVQLVRPHEAGGHLVVVDGVKHRVAPGQDPIVAPGDDIEPGDALSNGLPNPREIVQHKGIGEGRRYWVGRFREAMADAGLPVKRRILEVIARGLINHVNLTDEVGPHAPGDVVPYDELERDYEPRPGHRAAKPRSSVGKYLERPVLHYTVGTRVTPSVAKEMDSFGVKDVLTHPDPPPFEPQFLGAQYNLTRDPDWMTRQLGTRLEAGFLEATHRARTSDPEGTSYVPSMARLADFGEHGLTKEPKPPQEPKL